MSRNGENVQDDSGAFWGQVSAILGVEAEDVLETKEIAEILKQEAVCLQLEELDLVAKLQTIGCSKRRHHRVLFSALLTAVYSMVLSRDSARVDEIQEYLEERMKDVDKQVRHNCVVFVLSHAHAFTGPRLRRVVRIMADLLKNKSRSIRIFYFKLLSANIDRLAPLLTRADAKHLFKTLFLVLNFSANLPKKDSYLIRKVFELGCSLGLEKADCRREILALLKPVSLAEAGSTKLVQLLAKGLHQELLSDTFFRHQFAEQTPENEWLLPNLLYILQWGLAHKKSLYHHYAALAVQPDLPLEYAGTLIKLLHLSPFQTERTEHLGWLEEKLDEVASSTAPLAPAAISALISAYLSYLKDSPPVRASGAARLLRLYRQCEPARLPLLSLLAQLETELADQFPSFASEVYQLSLGSPACLEVLVKHVNPFLYLDQSVVAQLLDQTNTLTFYTLLWYIYLSKQTTEPEITAISDNTVKSAVIFDITHKEFDLAVEFFVLLFSIRTTFLPDSVLSLVFSQTEAKLAKYFLEILRQTRQSREYLLSVFKELAESLSTLISPLKRGQTNEHAAASYFLAKYAQPVLSLLLYLMNHEEAYANLLRFLETVKPQGVAITPAETRTLKAYGVLNDRTAKRLQQVIAAITQPAVADLSSVTQLTTSATLNTNWMDNSTDKTNQHRPAG